MVRFADIIGQEQIKEHLQNAITQDKVSHAYILHGERNSGKEFITRVFAAALQCENKNDYEPCGECASCVQVKNNSQPDILFLTHEKPNTISVEDIRTQINGTISIKPYRSDKKIYIIREGEKMTPQAQNALLKTLEEPPEYAVIFILTENMDELLPTISSRCVLLNMKPVSNALVKKYLMDEMQIPDYKADICVAFARGNIGKAKLLASSEEFEEIKEEALALLKNIKDMELYEVLSAVKKISEYKVNIEDYLDILSIWYRDVLLFKATCDGNHLIFRDEIQYITQAANKSTYEGIEEVITAMEKAKGRLRANVSFDLTIELLLLTIKEN